MFRRRGVAVAVSALLAFVGVGISGCSNGQPDGYTHYDAGSHKIRINGVEYPLELPGRADLKVEGSSVIPSDLGVDAAVRGSDASREGIFRAHDGNEQFYFLLTDRFANGDTSNDDGGLGDDRLVSGYDPTNEGFYLGGDLRGIIDNLDYIKGLGTTAIWISPPMKNKPVQGKPGEESAGYHGYWVTDFTTIDPHFGTMKDFTELIDKAHDRGLKVYMDIITNHTADVISYKEDSQKYVPTTVKPYLDKAGKPVNLFEVAGKEDFPAIDPKSFPYTPIAGKEKKVPNWLNNVNLYHNRGDSTFTGESITMGDFFGLDDLMTENPKVVRGMEAIYQQWLATGVDGFRIDTVKHVNMDFWKEWTQAIKRKTDEDFFMFGEVYDTDVSTLSQYVRETDMDAVLDFPFQKAVVGYVNGGKAQGLADLFAQDSRYITERATALDLPTFLGNHDMGRIGSMLQGNKVASSIFAHGLMFTMRGQPVVYYGDEQEFAGNDGDKAARQPLFATEVPGYQHQQLLDGSEFGESAHMDRDNPLYKAIAKLSKYRKEHPGLSNGAQIELLNDGNTYAFSRIDPDEGVEYVVVANSASEPVQAKIPVLTTTSDWSLVMEVADGAVSAPANTPTPTASSSGGTTELTVDVPSQGIKVFKAGKKLERGSGITRLTGVKTADSAIELTAHTQEHRYANTTFFYRIVGSGKWFPLGSVAGPNPKIYHNLESMKDGTLLEYRAITDGGRGESFTYLVGGPDPTSGK
ncbi:alpha-amylase family glycosyl hydrolase [Arcanobacterium phocae]|uniref:alpha-amylase family glycosyl hydrolase n=1 Tax=Arcanobacterium phocae TaxID=131112 RepID=UPI001C0EF053|nr:alpha-amylase family glycosyl hydrolase [Arcanobacterium phocae]